MKNNVLLILSLIFVTSSIVSAQTAKRVVTNDDLEKYKVKREQAEADYRRTYKERGMPSPEELAERERESQKQRIELSNRIAIERQQNANVYQSRANDLRNQIINVEAQINYLNGQIGNTQNQNQVFFSPSQVYAVGYSTYGNYGRNYGGNRSYRQQTNAVNIANNVQAARNAAAGAPNPYYGTPLYPSSIQVVIGSNNVGRGGYRGGYYGGYGGYPVQYVGNNNSYGRDEIVSRLQYLQQVRAGLIAQWNQLDNEAHRAGVRIN